MNYRKMKFPDKKKVTVSMRLPVALQKELKRQCKEYGYGFSEYVRYGLDEYAAMVWAKQFEKQK